MGQVPDDLNDEIPAVGGWRRAAVLERPACPASRIDSRLVGTWCARSVCALCALC